MSSRREAKLAIAEILRNDPHSKDGITFNRLVALALCKNRNSTWKEQALFVEGELNEGSIIKLPNGNISLPESDYDSLKSNKLKMTSSANSSCGSPPAVRPRGRPRKGTTQPHNNEPVKRHPAVRVGERRKMAKKVFDPSDNNLPNNKKKRGRPVGSLNKSTIMKRLQGHESISNNRSVNSESMSQMSGDVESFDEIEQDEASNESHKSAVGVCFVCLVQKTRGCSDKLVECRDCSNKAHISCLQSGSSILKLRPDNTWQCPYCKTCVVCCETNDAGVLTVCGVCSDAYHALCHSPRIPERLKGWDQWECSNCLESRPIAPPQAVQPYLLPHELGYSKSQLGEDVAIDITIPEVGSWSTEEVYEYFSEHCPEAADLLKDQEFDGRAISLACRNDIVRGLGLNLGPALRLYRLIVKLQTRKDDFTLCWG